MENEIIESPVETQEEQNGQVENSQPNGDGEFVSKADFEKLQTSNNELRSAYNKRDSEISGLRSKIEELEKGSSPAPKRLSEYTKEELEELQLDPAAYAAAVRNDTLAEIEGKNKAQEEAANAEAQIEKDYNTVVTTFKSLGIEESDPQFETKVKAIDAAMEEMGFTKVTDRTIRAAYNIAFPEEAAIRNYDLVNKAGQPGNPQPGSGGGDPNNATKIPGFDQTRADDPLYYDELGRTPEGRKILEQIANQS